MLVALDVPISSSLWPLRFLSGCPWSPVSKLMTFLPLHWLDSAVGERCPALRPDLAQQPRLETILANPHDRETEAEPTADAGEIAGLEVSIAAAEHKLAAMRELATRHQVTHLGMPDFGSVTGRTRTGEVS
jgi:hypothetical protein